MGRMYQAYKTDSELERKGVVYEFDGFRITLARSGGSNSLYQQRLEALTKPYRRAIQTETISEKKSNELLMQAYIDTVVVNWEVQAEDESWVQGIEGPDGEIQPFNKENVKFAFEQLPDLYLDIKELSNKTQGYKAAQLENEAKN